MQDVRDWVLVVTGIVWTIVSVVLLAMTLAIHYFVHKYLGTAHSFLRGPAREFLGEVQERAEDLRIQSHSLPRYEAAGAVPSGQRRPGGTGIRLSLPFFRRRKSWWQRLLGI